MGTARFWIRYDCPIDEVICDRRTLTLHSQQVSFWGLRAETESFRLPLHVV